MLEHATSTTDHRTRTAPAGARAVAVALVLVGAVLGCGSESQSSARDRAATTACGKLESCGQLDAGQIYTSRDDCQVKQSDYWQSTWPPAECDGKIDSNNLDRCITAIDQAQCGNGLDFLDIVLNKCTRDSVCDGM